MATKNETKKKLVVAIVAGLIAGLTSYFGGKK